ncbi:hypothetical protein GN956_G89 [Arapaima gigas]
MQAITLATQIEEKIGTRRDCRVPEPGVLDLGGEPITVLFLESLNVMMRVELMRHREATAVITATIIITDIMVQTFTTSMLIIHTVIIITITLIIASIIMELT